MQPVVAAPDTKFTPSAAIAPVGNTYTEVWNASAFTSPRVITGFTHNGSSGGGDYKLQVAIGAAGSEVIVGEVFSTVPNVNQPPIPLLIPASTRVAVKTSNTNNVNYFRVQHASLSEFAGFLASSWTVRGAGVATTNGSNAWVEVWNAAAVTTPTAIVGMAVDYALTAGALATIEFGLGAAGSEVAIPASVMPSSQDTIRFGKGIQVPASTRLVARNANSATTAATIGALYCVNYPLPQLQF